MLAVLSAIYKYYKAHRPPTLDERAMRRIQSRQAVYKKRMNSYRVCNVHPQIKSHTENVISRYNRR